jgi:two-component system KDP operon response regulator KdpE
MNKPDILVIDDEPQIRKLLQITLESNDFNIAAASSAREGLAMAANHPPALILLDLGLPDKSGQQVLKELKHWFNHPIIILSVLNSEEDIIYALDSGADDYLVKPFRTGELLARIRLALRKEIRDSEPVISNGKISIDLTARIVRKEGEQVRLTSTEYNLLALLARNEGKVLTHRHILKEVWGPGYENQSQYLRVFVAQLRKKIEDNPNEPHYIITEPGVGYRFVAMEE